MTRAYCDQRKYAKNTKAIFKAHGKEDKFNAIFEERNNQPVFHAAARMVRFFAKPYSEFKHIFEISINDSKIVLNFEDVFKDCPIITITPNDPTSLRVFYNIPLSVIDDASIASCSWIFYFNVLDKFWEDYKNDLNGARAQGWSPFNRAWGRIKRYEDLPTARALSRFTKLKNFVTDAQLRDIAAGIDEQRKPMELIFVDKPEDFCKMYASGPQSCMSYNRDGYKSWCFMDKHNVHPTSLFAYHPYMRGVYSNYKGSVIARTMLYQKADGVWYYGRLYCQVPKLLAKFEQTLKEKGYKWLGKHDVMENKYRRACSFEVPGIQYDSDWALPLPYCDNLNFGMTASFDPIKKTFTVNWSEKDVGTINIQQGTGHILSRHLNNRKCLNCGTIEREKRFNETNDGRYYCSSTCCDAQGYCHAERSDGSYIWMLKKDAYFDEYRVRWYSNIDALKHRGGLPFNSSIDEIDEEEELFTSKGYIIEKNGELFRHPTLAASVVEDAIYKGHILNTGNTYKDGTIIYKLDKYYANTEGRPDIIIHEQRVVYFDTTETLVA